MFKKELTRWENEYNREIDQTNHSEFKSCIASLYVRCWGCLLDETLDRYQEAIHKALFLFYGLFGSRLTVPSLIINALAFFRPDVNVVDHIALFRFL